MFFYVDLADSCCLSGNNKITFAYLAYSFYYLKKNFHIFVTTIVKISGKKKPREWPEKIVEIVKC